jgi:hypothetical protein
MKKTNETGPTKRKSRKGKSISQHQDYNNIIQENIAPLFKSFMLKVFDMMSLDLEPVKGDKRVYRTVYRDPDILMKVVNANKTPMQILHGEVHLKDEVEINYRFLEYGGMLARANRLPVDQYVLFIGNGKPINIQENTDMGSIKGEIKIRYMQEFKASDILNETEAEAVLMAILSDFEEKPVEDVIFAILKRIHQLTTDHLQLENYYKQLEILSNLRNLQPVTIKILNTMPIYYDLTTDLRYQQGVAQGVAQGEVRNEAKKNKEFVTNLLTQGDFTDEQIANFANVSVSYVQEIRASSDSSKNSSEKSVTRKKKK